MKYIASNQQIKYRDQLPPFVRETTKLMMQVMALDRQRMQNISQQISVVRAAEGLAESQRLILYEQRLAPLFKQGEEIEREAQAMNVERQMKDISKRTGYSTQ